LVLTGGANSSGIIHYTYGLTLPSPYSASYLRKVALAGYDFNIKNVVRFTLVVDGYTSDTTAIIHIEVTEPAVFYRLSVFVLLTQASNWVYALNSSKPRFIQPTSAPTLPVRLRSSTPTCSR
jgi:hypothetical protein